LRLNQARPVGQFAHMRRHAVGVQGSLAGAARSCALLRLRRAAQGWRRRLGRISSRNQPLGAETARIARNVVPTSPSTHGIGPGAYPWADHEPILGRSWADPLGRSLGPIPWADPWADPLGRSLGPIRINLPLRRKIASRQTDRSTIGARRVALAKFPRAEPPRSDCVVSACASALDAFASGHCSLNDSISFVRIKIDRPLVMDAKEAVDSLKIVAAIAMLHSVSASPFPHRHDPRQASRPKSNWPPRSREARLSLRALPSLGNRAAVAPGRSAFCGNLCRGELAGAGSGDAPIRIRAKPRQTRRKPRPVRARWLNPGRHAR
jgi:hypothetical protein